ncbi:MAG: hypothetical protein ABS70_04705 [Nitrospira sp. SCN 59-13]|nr:MAG: hypothetical protein ABS70_04705 [Nitrospira sp. SCN 59-13]
MMPAGAIRAAIQPPVLLATLSFVVLAGCGVLGAPIPPEDVGVAPVIERQLRREGLLASGASVRGSASRPSAPSGLTIEEAPIPPDPDPLPVSPWRTMGTR